MLVNVAETLVLHTKTGFMYTEIRFLYTETSVISFFTLVDCCCSDINHN